MAEAQRIIILEDDPTIRHIYRLAFQKAGFDVQAFQDAQAIVVKASAFQPVVILTDLLMPKIDGYEVLRLLKADAKTKNIPVVVISNLGDYVSQQKSAYLGVTDFLVKSNYTPSALVLRIRDVIAGKTPKPVVDPKVVGFLKAEEQARLTHAELTPAERQYA